ncbi:hypothetical protein M6D81_25600 [Paenibacillus sp. J5C_2022]|uniref:hypothetical protein n=1 Tax=Paenibacillus sp. J5C2022 TaxID=2977129 RepID=UPI0021D286BD|nr:hypothetical protein [Paenibacillus sp. J5C2022]MCU6712078.1 hypothetical protein [Paenibacillus sp. J5C2022]
MTEYRDGESGQQPEETALDERKPPGHMKQVWLGIGLMAVLHLLLFIVPVAFFFIGIAQVVYLLPAIFIVRKKSGIVQGLLIGAGVTFLLNAACFGLLLGGVVPL